MPSYVITGASRGIGLEYVRQLSAIPENQVFALVRNKATALEVPSSPLKSGLSNVYILEADVTSSKALKAAANKVAELTGGSLDVLINNAAALDGDNNWRGPTDFDGEDELLEQEINFAMKVNVIGVIYGINSFLPLLRRGATKKVVTISSSGGHREFVYGKGLSQMVAYGVSKAGLDVAITKFAVQLKDEGLIFILLCPGLVDTSATANKNLSEKDAEWIGKLTKSSPYGTPTGMISTETSVKNQLKRIAESTEKDNAAFFHTDLDTYITP